MIELSWYALYWPVISLDYIFDKLKRVKTIDLKYTTGIDRLFLIIMNQEDIYARTKR